MPARRICVLLRLELKNWWMKLEHSGVNSFASSRVSRELAKHWLGLNIATRRRDVINQRTPSFFQGTVRLSLFFVKR